MRAPSDVTRMLRQWSNGDPEALDRLFPLVYDELRRLAHARVHRERPGHTLNTTALVHEVYLNLAGLEEMRWMNRAHFFALASRVMRHLLVDYARRRDALKRGGDRQRVDFDEERLIPDSEVERVLDLDDALRRLAEVHSRPAQVIEQTYFGGLTNDETADVLGISRATVERDLRMARAWLALELSRASES